MDTTSCAMSTSAAKERCVLDQARSTDSIKRMLSDGLIEELDERPDPEFDDESQTLLPPLSSSVRLTVQFFREVARSE